MSTSMRQSFSRFIDALAVSVDVVGMHAALDYISAALGFPSFAYLSVPHLRRTNPTLISNYSPTWTQRYFDLHYARLDPVISAARASIDPFLWCPEAEQTGLSAAQREFFEEARIFGIRTGFTVPLAADDNGFVAVTFALDERATTLRRLVDAHASALHLSSLLFHRRAEATILSGCVVAGVKLTKREYECLSWAARGKSAWDTGRIIGRSARTVTYHLDNVRAKLGVKTTAQAIALLAAALRESSF